MKPIMWLLCAALLQAGTAGAEDDKRSAQLREAARRAQASLQQAQQELAAAKAERDKLSAADQAHQQELAATQAKGRSQAAGLRTQLEQAQGERERVQAELAREQKAREELAAQHEALQAKLLAAQGTLAEQQRLTQTVAALLERSAKSLATAEEANRALYALGVKAVEAYTERTPEAMRARDEPFLGLAAVRLGNEAEELRREMANQRVVP